MEGKYTGITGHIPSLEDHGHLYMYYGLPHSDHVMSMVTGRIMNT